MDSIDKISFVSGHSGTNLMENLLLLSVLPLSYLTWHVIRDLPVCRRWNHYAGFLLESFIFCFILLFTCTIWQRHVTLVVIVLVLFNAARLLYKCVQTRPVISPHVIRNTWHSVGNKMYTHERRFVAAFKSFILITSAVCILAVDFVIFPRRFAKAEEFGVGLMDGGVGAFIVGNGITSSYARYYHDHYDNVKVFKKNLLSSLPLLVLGLMRVVFIIASGYHVHVSEYGVHWNFFLTLAAVKILSSLLFLLVPYKLSVYVGVCVACCYQLALTHTSLQLYLLDDSERDTVLSSNKEGVVSSVGYLALYMMSVGVGQYIFQARDRYRQWCSVLVTLLLTALLSLSSLPLLEFLTDIASRRLLNLTYCVLAMGLSCALLAAFLAVELLLAFIGELGLVETGVGSDRKWHVPISDPPRLIMMLKGNGLFYFILTNLLTGAVNMCINTLTVDNMTALTILAAYILTANSLTYMLSGYEVKTKYW